MNAAFIAIAVALVSLSAGCSAVWTHESYCAESTAESTSALDSVIESRAGHSERGLEVEISGGGDYPILIGPPSLPVSPTPHLLAPHPIPTATAIVRLPPSETDRKLDPGEILLQIGDTRVAADTTWSQCGQSRASGGILDIPRDQECSVHLAFAIEGAAERLVASLPSVGVVEEIPEAGTHEFRRCIRRRYVPFLLGC